jgi:hypothetical protein
MSGCGASQSSIPVVARNRGVPGLRGYAARSVRVLYPLAHSLRDADLRYLLQGRAAAKDFGDLPATVR